jgi:hypothetical protein
MTDSVAYTGMKMSRPQQAEHIASPNDGILRPAISNNMISTKKYKGLYVTA